MGRSAEKMLKQEGVGFLTHRWRPFATFAELLERQGTYRVVATVAVQSSDRIVLVALRAEDRLDLRKLGRVLGVDRDAVTLAAPGEAADRLEVDPGFETILTDTDIDLFVDERVLRLDKVLVSSGRNDRLLELRPADLASVTGATVADLTADPDTERT